VEEVKSEMTKNQKKKAKKKNKESATTESAKVEAKDQSAQVSAHIADLVESIPVDEFDDRVDKAFLK
jgi:hypothetical protein